MRCHICDERLEPQEIKQDLSRKSEFKPCSTCLSVSNETYKGYELAEGGGINDEDIREYFTDTNRE